MRRGRGVAAPLALLAGLATGTEPRAVVAQEVSPPPEGSTAAQIGGGLLGFYSSAMLGSIGAMIPCGQTYIGVRCVQLSGALTGMAGLVSGVTLGGRTASASNRRPWGR